MTRCGECYRFLVDCTVCKGGRLAIGACNGCGGTGSVCPAHGHAPVSEQ